MYSGLALSNRSGNWLGVHQKFDRVAYRQLCRLLELEGQKVFFPSLKQILHFEGRNGPDGLKIKSPGIAEPHHFYNPHKPLETGLLNLLQSHSDGLIKALRQRESEKAAFEAAWLAHVITDGLTPAHHYPYQEQSQRLRGEAIGRQTKILSKVFIKRKQIAQGKLSTLSWWSFLDKNWRLWGSRGLILHHSLFELGVALIVKPANLSRTQASFSEISNYEDSGLVPYFKQVARQIADYETYRNFQTWGWTPKLTIQIRYLLVPQVINLITLAWREAIYTSQLKPVAETQSRTRFESLSIPSLYSDAAYHIRST